MKKALLGLIVGLMVASVGVAGASVAGSLSAKRSIPARVKALEGKVRNLTSGLAATEGQVTAAEGRLTTAENRLSCLHWVGMTSYGVPASGNGYFYTNDGGATYFVASAVDLTDSGQTPQLYVVQIPAACTGGNAFDRLPVHAVQTARAR